VENVKAVAPKKVTPNKVASSKKDTVLNENKIKPTAKSKREQHEGIEVLFFEF
jgi:hypothetical protein